jgi:predicted CXXCH cytochrome family protein
MKELSVMINTFFTILILLSSSVTGYAREYAIARAPGAGITKTSHDLKHQFGVENMDLCSWCHAPHDDMGLASQPLWGQKDVTQGFTVYSQGPDEPAEQLDEEAAETRLYSPGPSSMICLSCHDGSNASNKYGFMSRIMGGGSIESFSYSGHSPVARLKDHPIGFDYRRAEDSMVDLRTSSEQVTETYFVKDLLRQGRMECTTCHDVHNYRNEGEKFLWVSDARSNFCFTCHKK